MCPSLRGMSTLGLSGLRKADVHPPTLAFRVWHTLALLLACFSDDVLCTFARLVLPPESCHVGIVNRLGTPAVKTIGQSAAIPRLTLKPVSQSVSSECNSNGSSFISAAVKRHSSSSSASVLVPSLTAPNVVNQNSSPESVPVSSPCNSITASKCSSSKSTFTESAVKCQASPFRTQMILFQQSGQPHLLEISSNCEWESIRSKVLARLSDLTKTSGSYPQPCTTSVDGFRVTVQPRPKFRTEIPARLRESIGMSSMFAIRVRITAEEKPLATTNSVVMPHVADAAKPSASMLRDCDDLDVGSVCSDRTNRRTIIDLTQQQTDTNASQLNTNVDIARPQSTSVADSIRERTAGDLSQQAAAIAATGQQKTDMTPQSTVVNISQHLESGLLANMTNLLSKDCSSMSKSVCSTGSTDGAVEIRSKLLLGPEAVGTTAQDTHDSDSGCYGVDTGSNVSCCTSAYSCAYSDNMRNDVINISAECTRTVSSCTCADNGNFLAAADNVNFASSSGQTQPEADCAEVTCSLQADDGNFPSSPGLSVPIGCPVDLCT